MKLHRTLWGGAAAALLAGLAPAQSYRDFTVVRNRPSAWAEVLQIRAGLLGSIAGDENKAIGLEDELGWDGHAYYRNDQLGGREAALDLYAGRDGAYASVVEGSLLGGGSQSRIELHTRYFPFFREGYYSGGDFVPTGRYEGADYGGGVYVGREVGEGLRLEIGAFYERHTFDANEDTAANFTIPDDYNAYGGRVFLEHNTVQLDRLTGRAADGFVLTLVGEREQNDSDRRWGTNGIWQSQLPSGLWRARGHLEWYFPQTESGTWEVSADASIADRKDRVHNYDAQRPPGELWVDAELRYRVAIGQAFTVAPLVKGQYVRLAADDGLSSGNEFFFGGGLQANLALSDTLELVGDYSYLSNEYREPISTSRDTFGEHRFFFGIEVRFGATRR